MNLYLHGLDKLKALCFSNQVQIDIVVETKREIDLHYFKDLNLDHLAHKHATSKYHLIRIFRKYYGVTPRQYLINKRIEKAKFFLKSNMSVSDTCFKIGFHSIPSFSNLFKSKIGMSPSKYKQAIFDNTRIKK